MSVASAVLNLVLTGTNTAPALAVPNAATIHSAELGAQMATRSLLSMPVDANAPAAQRILSMSSVQLRRKKPSTTASPHLTPSRGWLSNFAGRHDDHQKWPDRNVRKGHCGNAFATPLVPPLYSGASRTHDPVMHHVKYTITASKPIWADIYYLDQEPPIFSAYSHSPPSLCRISTSTSPRTVRVGIRTRLGKTPTNRRWSQSAPASNRARRSFTATSPWTGSSPSPKTVLEARFVRGETGEPPRLAAFPE